MAVVIDASVALKWALLEDGSAAARRLAATEILAAPDLLFIECANVLSMKVRRGLLTEADANLAMLLIDGVPIRTVPARARVAAAQVIAFELRQTAYDSLYLAIALAERVELVTADEAFARSAMAHPLYGRSVRLLGP
ncbi:MAG TPA: type II toxin-antitoxin system VapC family toxin [Caulobacteraceae bacterium]